MWVEDIWKSYAVTSHPGFTPQLIPKIIHQTWKNETVPAKWENAVNQCRSIYSGWEYRLWTDKDGREFIKENYPSFLSTFDGYKYPIQRADALRYFIIFHFGGVYLDLDVGCAENRIDHLLHYDAIIPKTKPVGYSNDVLMAKPKHPFFLQLINNLKRWDHSFVLPYLTVFFSTGPMYLNLQFGNYLEIHSDVFVLDPELYSETEQKHFKHYEGNSWHQWDSYLIFLIWKALRSWFWIVLAIAVYALIRRSKRIAGIKATPILPI
ncbi:hypothetical protein HDV01_006869 [Terramyces sp. JEL0728]|nr:hypothetical protein HDV01_006869 [Terramyces sp. JEL0728]